MRARAVAALVALTLVGGAGYVYGSGGSERFSVQRSPHGDEAIEFYTATRWQRWFGPRGDLVGYVGLRRLSDDAMVATSPPFALSGEGEVFWNAESVQIGSSAVFDRKQARWKVLQ